MESGCRSAELQQAAGSSRSGERPGKAVYPVPGPEVSEPSAGQAVVQTVQEPAGASAAAGKPAGRSVVASAGCSEPASEVDSFHPSADSA